MNQYTQPHFRQTGDNSRRVATEKDKREGLYLTDYEGLTILQHFASLNMQGMIAACDGWAATPDMPEIAKRSVAGAKALIAELNKQ